MKVFFTPPFPQIRLALAICILIVVLSCPACSVLLPVSANGASLGGSKVGTATAIGVLGFWPNNDASIETAAKNGGITKVSTVNVKVSSYLWIVTTYETKVTGD